MEQGCIHRCQCPECRSAAGSPSTKVLHERMNLLCSTLDERQRRLYAGLEAVQLGHGGDRFLSLITGLSAKTVACGRRELDDLVMPGRVRQPGGGRLQLEKKRGRVAAGAATTAPR